MANLVLLPVWFAVQESGGKGREDKTNVHVRKDLQRGKGKHLLSPNPGRRGGSSRDHPARGTPSRALSPCLEQRPHSCAEGTHLGRSEVEQGWESSPHPGIELSQLRTLCHLYFLCSAPVSPPVPFPCPVCAQGTPSSHPHTQTKGKGDTSRGFPFSLLKTHTLLPSPAPAEEQPESRGGVSAAPELRGAFPAHRERGQGCLGL